MNEGISNAIELLDFEAAALAVAAVENAIKTAECGLRSASTLVKEGKLEEHALDYFRLRVKQSTAAIEQLKALKRALHHQVFVARELRHD